MVEEGIYQIVQTNYLSSKTCETSFKTADVLFAFGPVYANFVDIGNYLRKSFENSIDCNLEYSQSSMNKTVDVYNSKDYYAFIVLRTYETAGRPSF